MVFQTPVELKKLLYLVKIIYKLDKLIYYIGVDSVFNKRRSIYYEKISSMFIF